MRDFIHIFVMYPSSRHTSMQAHGSDAQQRFITTSHQAKTFKGLTWECHSTLLLFLAFICCLSCCFMGLYSIMLTLFLTVEKGGRHHNHRATSGCALAFLFLAFFFCLSFFVQAFRLINRQQRRLTGTAVTVAWESRATATCSRGTLEPHWPWTASC